MAPFSLISCDMVSSRPCGASAKSAGHQSNAIDRRQQARGGSETTQLDKAHSTGPNRFQHREDRQVAATQTGAFGSTQNDPEAV